MSTANDRLISDTSYVYPYLFSRIYGSMCYNGLVKTTVDITTPLLDEAKHYASANGLTVRQVIESGLRRVLDERQTQATPFRLKKRTFKGEGLVADADWPTIRRRIYEGRGG